MDQSVYEIIKIEERGWRIEENGVRFFVFAGQDKALLIDSGFGQGNIRQSVEELTSLSVMLLNTHSDRDHIGGNGVFEKAYMHPSEFERYQEKSDGRCPAEAIWEGDIIDLGGRQFEVLLLPGHTPGSIALLDAQNRILISGDTVQLGMIFMFSSGRNFDAYIQSLKKLTVKQSAFDTIYPSHGEFPVDPDVIEELIFGAEKIISGCVKGENAPFETSALLYEIGRARFLYEPK